MNHHINHIAFIPDGNRRYAKRKGISTLAAHKEGYFLFKEVINWCRDRKINEISFWAFSTENWKRSQEEISYLFNFFMDFLVNDISEFIDDKAKLRIIGRRHDLSPKLVKAIEKAEQATAEFEGKVVNIFFNYGGRVELENAIKNIVDSGISSNEITSEIIQENLWSSEISNPDLIIRTSGEQRLSGFIPWQSGYSELYFSELYWPELNKEELDKAIAWFSTRSRRFGGDDSSTQSA